MNYACERKSIQAQVTHLKGIRKFTLEPDKYCSVLALSNCIEHDISLYAILEHVEVEF